MKKVRWENVTSGEVRTLGGWRTYFNRHEGSFWHRDEDGDSHQILTFSEYRKERLRRVVKS